MEKPSEPVYVGKGIVVGSNGKESDDIDIIICIYD